MVAARMSAGPVGDWVTAALDFAGASNRPWAVFQDSAKDCMRGVLFHGTTESRADSIMDHGFPAASEAPSPGRSTRSVLLTASPLDALELADSERGAVLAARYTGSTKSILFLMSTQDGLPSIGAPSRRPLKAELDALASLALSGALREGYQAVFLADLGHFATSTEHLEPLNFIGFNSLLSPAAC